MIVSAHQPHYLPWSGYINKIYLSDVFMVMDNMVYTNKGFINRNRILNARGIQYLTVPLLKPYGLLTKINELLIDTKTRSNWRDKHLRGIRHNYAKGKGFPDFFPRLESVLTQKYDCYFDLQFALIKMILLYLEIEVKIILASDNNTGGIKETELIERIIQDGGGDKMLLGLGASTKYVDIDYVKAKGYDIVLQNFEHPVYKQKGDLFIDGISVIDLILNNTREESIALIKQSGHLKKI